MRRCTRRLALAALACCAGAWEHDTGTPTHRIPARWRDPASGAAFDLRPLSSVGAFVFHGNQARARLHNRRRHAGRRPVSCALVRIGAGKTRSIARGPQLSTYVFECELWKRLAWTPVVLKQVMRQRDEAFVAVLDAIRAGERRPFPTWPEARPARDAADLPYR